MLETHETHPEGVSSQQLDDRSVKTSLGYFYLIGKVKKTTACTTCDLLNAYKERKSLFGLRRMDLDILPRETHKLQELWNMFSFFGEGRDEK